MKDALKTLSRHSLVYAVGNALSVAAGFILIPMYTNVLSTSEYGILELLNRTADILILVMLLGVRQGFIRMFFDKQTEDGQKQVVGTTLMLIITSSLIIAFLCYPFRYYAAEKLFQEPAYGILLTLLLIWLPLEILFNIGLTYLQIRMKSILFVTLSFIKLICLIVSNMVLVYWLKKGIAGVLITNLWVAGILSLGFMVFFVRWSGLRVSFALMKELLAFGLPYLPAAFFMFIISNADRYFLTYYSSLDSVGIYALAYKIGMIGTMFVMEPFTKVWSPFLFDNYNKKDGHELISKVFALFTLAIITVALGISVLSPVVIPFISGQDFHDSYKVVPVICFSGVFYGMAQIADAGILISKKTYLKPFIFGMASIISIGLNFLLIPRYGALGAAITLSSTFFALFVINYIISNRYYAINIEYKKIFVMLSAAIITFIIFIWIFESGDKQGTARYLSLTVIGLFPLMVWFGGVFSKSEKLMIWGFIRKC